jgi:hypothetical protein
VFVVIVAAAIVICVGVVAVAMGRGGELARPAPEVSSVPDFASGVDVARFRPPPALLGYHAGATQRALLLAGRAIADRDAEISWLRDQLRELRPEGEREDGSIVAGTRLSGAEAPPVAETKPGLDPDKPGLDADQLAGGEDE